MGIKVGVELFLLASCWGRRKFFHELKKAHLIA